jgi:hypothetical protein
MICRVISIRRSWIRMPPPLDTRYNYTKSDWEMFTAATAGQNTQQIFISDLAKWINETPTSDAMTDLYDAQTGE